MSGFDYRVGTELEGIARNIRRIADELTRFNDREEARDLANAREGR